MRATIAICSALCWLALAAGGAADEIDDHLAAIAGTGPQGAGAAQARAACDALSLRGVEILPRLLLAMDTGNPLAANWLRAAFESIVEREIVDREITKRQQASSPDALPIGPLADFVRDEGRSGRARRLALRICQQADPAFSAREIPRLLSDPEFRDDAVEMALSAGQQALEGGDSETARDRFHAAFEHARDSRQVVRAASKLSGLGEQVDIAAHLGLVTDWWVVGPFDAPGTSGFARSFPPEQSVDLRARYPLSSGQTIAWTRHHASDSLGLVNLAQAIAPAQEAVGYAYAEITSPGEQSGQLRCGADDNCSVWLNGEKVFAREQWLNGTRLDRFITPVRLREGRNRVLVKICQGPQHKDPQVANNWSLQLRFCDASGRGLQFAQDPGATR